MKNHRSSTLPRSLTLTLLAMLFLTGLLANISGAAEAEKKAAAAPANSDPAKVATAKTEPAKAAPTKTEPAKAAPAKKDPAEVAKAKTEPAKAAPAKTEPAKGAKAKTEPAKKAAPAKTEPAKPAAKPTDTPPAKPTGEKTPSPAPKKAPIVPLYDVNMMQVAIVAFVVEVNEEYIRDVGVKSLYDRNVDSLHSLEVAEVSSTFLPNVTNGLDLFLENDLSDGSVISARIKALLEQDKAEIRTRPIVITMHNKPATIETVDEIPFQDVKFNPKNGSAGLAVTYEKVGIKLQVTPKVLEPLAKELVELNLTNIEISSVSRFVTINAINRPIFSRSQATTKVVLHNKDTLVIGGLKSRREVVSEDRIPYIGRIPLLGWLFKSHHKEMRDNDIFILITPHILPPGTNPILPFDFKHQEILDEPLANPSVGNMFE